MSITKMSSYDLKGTKLSFADWISNISPTETPFCSMTGKEAINQTTYQWQEDIIPVAKADNAALEGSVPPFEDQIASTTVVKNYTQIFRRGVSVSDTANAVAHYGRGKEIGYQMEKAGLEIKRDMEVAFLNQKDDGKVAVSGTGGLTGGFQSLCSKAEGTTAPDTGAKTYIKSGGADKLPEDKIFEMTYNLYLANSKANIIMFHPKHAGAFSYLLSLNAADSAQDKKGNRMKMFGAMEDTYNTEVDTIIDPLGQKFALVPNRHMPTDAVYFFNPSDWTQMVLRAPKKIQLAKVGSSEEWVIEAEVGLRHRNKFASGVLKLEA